MSSWHQVPAVSFTPAQNHQVELSISLIHKIPGVSGKTQETLIRQFSANTGRTFLYYFCLKHFSFLYAEPILGIHNNAFRQFLLVVVAQRHHGTVQKELSKVIQDCVYLWSVWWSRRSSGCAPGAALWLARLNPAPSAEATPTGKPSAEEKLQQQRIQLKTRENWTFGGQWRKKQ